MSARETERPVRAMERLACFFTFRVAQGDAAAGGDDDGARRGAGAEAAVAGGADRPRGGQAQTQPPSFEGPMDKCLATAMGYASKP